MTLEEAESRGIYTSYDRAGHGGNTPSELEKKIRSLREDVEQLTKRAEKAEKEAANYKEKAQAAEGERDRQQKNFDTFSSMLNGEHKAKDYQHDERKREQETTMAKIKKNAGIIGFVTGVVALVTTVVKSIFTVKKGFFAAAKLFSFL